MIDRVNSLLLKAAVDRVLQRWTPEWGYPLALVQDTLRALASALDEQVPAPSGLACPAESELSLRLLERLRAEVIEFLSISHPPPSVDELLPLLQAFERVQSHLQSRLSDRPSVTLLGQPYTPELVVELAHDLRSPLTSILFLSDALRQGQSGEVNTLQYRQLGIIYSAALSLVSMAGDVIEYARGGEQLTEQQPSPFSVSEMLGSIVDLVQPMADERGVDLRTRAPARDQLLGYPVPLSRVLLNLTTNALKATENGFVEIKVTERPPTVLEFAVQDSGPGIDEEMREHLFKPFKSKNSSAVGFSGAGLGLTICQRLVTAMGGELRYKTELGRGTCFYFSLDIASARPN